MRITRTTILIIVFFWLLITFFTLGQDYLHSQIREERFYFWEALSFKTGWLLYIPVTLAVFRLGNIHPMRPGAVAKALPVHLAGSLLSGLLYTVGFAAFLSFLWNWLICPVSFAQMWQKALATNLLYSLLMYWLILGAHSAFAAYGQVEQLRLEREKAGKLLLSTRLEALKMQLQPHFLFNVHHTIIGLMQQGQTRKATAMLLKVSDLLRISLREQVADLVPLHKELRLVQLYADIQQIRLGERLRVEWVVPPGLEQALLPPMLLQPLLENTFKHGIEPYAKAGVIRLQVSARKILYKLPFRTTVWKAPCPPSPLALALPTRWNGYTTFSGIRLPCQWIKILIVPA